jgi:hypothetical protein
MELDKILYKESSLRNFYNYTIKFPKEEKRVDQNRLIKLFVAYILKILGQREGVRNQMTPPYTQSY